MQYREISEELEIKIKIKNSKIHTVPANADPITATSGIPKEMPRLEIIGIRISDATV
mgnify:CR=1 FL=1